MSPRHHLNEATLVSYAAGALSDEMAAVVCTHLEGCRHCSALVADAEGIGGALLAQKQPTDDITPRFADLRDDMMRRLDETPKPRAAFAGEAQPSYAAADPDLLPAPLRAYFGRSWSALRWRWLAPGVYMIRAEQTGKDSLILLKIAAGKKLPVHSHHGTELTQVLSGAYEDALGRFDRGDVADLDTETLHQPVTTAGATCICVAALDAPLRFPGWLARKMQPLVGL